MNLTDLQLAELAKTVGDDFDRELADIDNSRATVFRERMRNSLRKSVGVTDDVERLRSLIDLDRLVREETAAVDADIERLRTGEPLNKANGDAYGTAQTASGQPINIDIHLHQPTVQRQITFNRDADDNIESVTTVEVPTPTPEVTVPTLAPDAYNPNSYL